MILSGKCSYCNKLGQKRIDDSESSCICDGCWKILKNPITALPFLRGHLTLELRGTMPERQLQDRINKFMEIVSKWKKKTDYM